MEGARVAVARAWPGCGESICILAKSPGISPVLGGLVYREHIVEEQSRQGGGGRSVDS